MFHELQKYDLEHDTSFVRELEMIIDHELANKAQGHIMQFWRDVQLYGVDEALLYLINDGLVDAEQQKRIAGKIADIKGVIYADTTTDRR